MPPGLWNMYTARPAGLPAFPSDVSGPPKQRELRLGPADSGSFRRIRRVRSIQ